MGGRALPGLKQAATPELHPGLARELRELSLATGHQRARSVIARSSEGRAPVKRGRLVLNELRAALTYLLDDGTNERGARQLRRFAAAHPSHPGTHHGLALALETYAIFAEEHWRGLKGLPDLDPGIVDEARLVARALREHSGRKQTNGDRAARQAALSLRNRFAVLLFERMARVRRAARYVFRKHPDIVHKATSSYERTRRAKARARARKRD